MPIGIKEKVFSSRIAGLLHRGKTDEAAGEVAEYCKIDLGKKGSQKADKSNTILQFYLHSLLEDGGFTEAAQMLWTPAGCL